MQNDHFRFVQILMIYEWHCIRAYLFRKFGQSAREFIPYWVLIGQKFASQVQIKNGFWLGQKQWNMEVKL